MIRLLLRPGAWILSLCIVLSGAALALGAVLAAEVRAPALEACELPCWGGLKPGETAFADAQQILAGRFPEAGLATSLIGSTLAFQMHSGDQLIHVMVYSNHGSVGTIYLNMVVPFAYLMEQLAAPDCIWVNQAPDSRAQLFVHWKRGDLFIRTVLVADEHGRLDVGLLAHDVEISPYDGGCDGAYAVPWLGFAPAWRYIMERDRHL